MPKRSRSTSEELPVLGSTEVTGLPGDRSKTPRLAEGAPETPPAAYDREAILHALEEMEPSPPLDWIERLDVTSAAPVEIVDPDDDLEREKQL
jgi:hypothetical protein